MTNLSTTTDKELKKEAHKVLSNYRRLKRITGRSYTDLSSPIITDMPKSPQRGNITEDKWIKNIDAQQEQFSIETALSLLPDVSRQVLSLCYCEKNYHSNFAISQLVKTYSENGDGQIIQGGYSERTIERIKSRALLEFAEAYHL